MTAYLIFIIISKTLSIKIITIVKKYTVNSKLPLIIIKVSLITFVISPFSTLIMLRRIERKERILEINSRQLKFNRLVKCICSTPFCLTASKKYIPAQWKRIFASTNINSMIPNAVYMADYLVSFLFLTSNQCDLRNKIT